MKLSVLALTLPLAGLVSTILAATGAGPLARVPHYSLVKVWSTNLGPRDPSRYAVCADGRTYVVTREARFVVVSPAGEILEDEPVVPALRSTSAAACGPHDLLYAAGARLKVLKWVGPGQLSVVSSAPLPLVAALQMAVAADGDAMVRGYGAPGRHIMFLMRQDGTVITAVGGIPKAAGNLLGGGLRASLTFDARGHRFVEVPWDDYEFHTYGLRGKPLGTYGPNDKNFHPAHAPRGYAGLPVGGDMVPKVVALPDGDFLAEVVKRYTGAGGTIHNSGEYLEVLDASFRHVADAWTWTSGGEDFGDLRGADAAGNLYFDYPGTPGDFGVVKMRLVKQ